MAKRAKAEDGAPDLRDDPRMRDPAMWQRLRLMVEHEAVDRAWGCPLYILNRTGVLTNEQREAGDKYQQIVSTHWKLQQTDPDEMPEPARELAAKRVERAKEKYEDAVEVLGLGRNVVDWLVLHEEPLGSESQRRMAKDALQLLANFFNRGNKKRTRIVV
jgi:hypothetical protein